MSITLKIRDFLNESKVHLGYKIISYDGKDFYSLYDRHMKYNVQIGSIVNDAKGIYLGTSRNFAIDYYGGSTDVTDVLLTYEFADRDIIKGDPNDKDLMTGGTEMVVKRAKLIKKEVL